MEFSGATNSNQPEIISEVADKDKEEEELNSREKEEPTNASRRVLWASIQAEQENKETYSETKTTEKSRKGEGKRKE